MSRIRTVKPELFLDGKLARVSIEARYLYVGLFTEADDEGRMLASTKRITGSLFPHDDNIGDAQVGAWIDELEQLGRIVRYADAESQYFYIPHFLRHQRISHPTPSRFPAPPEELLRASGEVPESIGPELGSGTRNREQGTGISTLALPRFAEFYEMYPRHVGRRRAEQAFQSAVKRVSNAGGDPEIIVAGARRYASDPNLPEQQFIAYPATWLNRDGWEDEPEAVRGNGHKRVDRAMEIAQAAAERRPK